MAAEDEKPNPSRSGSIDNAQVTETGQKRRCRPAHTYWVLRRRRGLRDAWSADRHRTTTRSIGSWINLTLVFAIRSAQ